MNRRTALLGAASALAAIAALAGAAAAQDDDFPQKPITLIVPSAPGGSTDVTARKTAELMGEHLGVTIVVENRPGGGTLIGSRHVAQSDPDGYTLLAQSSAVSMFPFTFRDPGVSLDDLRPIGVMLRQANVFSVGQASEFTSMADLIAHSEAHPEDLTFGTGGPASPISYTVEMFKHASGANLSPVQYKGAGDTFPDVIAGRVTMVSSGYSGQSGFYEQGQLRPLAVSGPERIASLPDVPTLREVGVPLDVSVWLGIFAVAGTPDPVVAKLSGALQYALEDEARRAEIIEQGGDPAFLAPEEFEALLAREAETFRELADVTGIEPQ
ncbi:Bug family tripartite tricarboxylate transporter substrate binding protein [Mangrovicoccus ximenensis]|uniref:Bug family tripartite tricarboxylate transporter substrate binding protein n=1 Tax=Mangrovicoccus ximenensis TaxID=1911570 RepID=UPI001374E1BE|nr:tripartite tricarboxylate transporter substrate binding protein [Mangrovicoccus ximenensis]